MITVYARKELTTDSTLLKYYPKTKKQDVQIYKDKDCQNKFARFSWYYRSKPTKRQKFIVLNCFRYALEWLPPKQ